MTEMLQQYLNHLEAYKIICRKPPDLMIDKIHIHNSPEEFKKFERKLGVRIDGNELHLFENFGNEAFFMEFAALLSFIPDKFRSFNVIRRILFIILYPKYETSIAKSSWLAGKFHIVIRKLERDLLRTSSTGFSSEDILYAYIKTVNIAHVLRELIPYLDPGIKKSDVIENVQYLFTPPQEFSYQMMTEIQSQGQILYEILEKNQKKGKISSTIPFDSIFNFTYRYLNLSQFALLLELNPDNVNNFQFVKNIQKIIASLPFFNQIYFSNNILFFLGYFSPEFIPVLSKFFQQLQQLKIINAYNISEIKNNCYELKTSKANLQGIRSQSISLEKTEKIDIWKSESFHYDRPCNNSISQLEFFLALNGRTFIPILSTIHDKKDFPIAIQQAMKGYLRANQIKIQPYLPGLYPLSSRSLSQKYIMEYYRSCVKSKHLQFSPLGFFFRLKTLDSIIISTRGFQRSKIIEENFAFYNLFETQSRSNNEKSSENYFYTTQFTWKDVLIGLTVLSFEPFSYQLHSPITIKKNLDVSFSQSFNFSTQKWDFSQISFSDILQKIIDLNKANEIKGTTPGPPKVGNSIDQKGYEMLTSPILIRRIIRKYRTIYQRLAFTKIDNDFIIDYLKKSLQSRYFLSSSETHKYAKPLRYIEMNTLPMKPFVHPILSQFSRIHVILTSRGLWLHPKSISSHEILRGLFTIGLVQCYYAGGIQDGILLLEYLIPNSFYSDSSSEFHRLIRKINSTANATGNYSVSVLEINTYILSINEWNLRAETFKTKQFMKFRTSWGRKSQRTQNQDQNPVYNFHYNRMPSGELSSTYKSMDLSTIPQESIRRLYAQNVIFNPVICWQRLLFLRHSIYFFIWIKNIPQNDERKANIVHFFQQFSLVEIFTSTPNDSGNLDFYIIIHLRNNIYFLERKILNQFSEWDLKVQYHYLFPYEIIRDSPITRIMEISRQNPFQRKKLNLGKSPGTPRQFPILRYYKQDKCFSPEETVQIYEKYYASSENPVDNINQIKKEFPG